MKCKSQNKHMQWIRIKTYSWLLSSEWWKPWWLLWGRWPGLGWWCFIFWDLVGVIFLCLLSWWSKDSGFGLLMVRLSRWECRGLKYFSINWWCSWKLSWETGNMLTSGNFCFVLFEHDNTIQQALSIVSSNPPKNCYIEILWMNN